MVISGFSQLRFKREKERVIVADSFLKTLKVEHIYHHNYKIFKGAELSVFEYIEAWYNVNKIHTTIKKSIRNKKEKFINQLVA